MDWPNGQCTVVEYKRGRHFKSFLKKQSLKRLFLQRFVTQHCISGPDRSEEERFAHNPMVVVSSPTHSTIFFGLIAIFANFKVQKHHDSTELYIPDFCHSFGYFMENILAYANSTLITAERMPYFYSKMKYFKGLNFNLSHFFTLLNNLTLFMCSNMTKT